MERDIVLEVTYAAAPEFVWRALTEPELLREWLMENLNSLRSFFSDAAAKNQAVITCLV